jgi:hypothetical protein
MREEKYLNLKERERERESERMVNYLLLFTSIYILEFFFSTTNTIRSTYRPTAQMTN